MTITTTDGTVKNRWKRLKGKMVTEKEYDAYMDKEHARVVAERKSLRASKKAKKVVKGVSAKKRAKSETFIEIPDIGQPVVSKPKVTRVKARTAGVPKVRSPAKPNKREMYYVMARPRNQAVPAKYFNPATVALTSNPKLSASDESLNTANDLAMTFSALYPQYQFIVRKSKR